MSLMIGGGGGSAKAYLKFNAKSGRWGFRALDGTENEISDPTFIADLANIATGWMKFTEGQPPEKIMDPAIDQAAPQPSREHKRGFILNVYSKNSFGGVAEIISTSMAVSNAIKAIHSQFESERTDNAGKVPVIAAKGAEAQKGKFGTNYMPKLSIAKWVDRPVDLADASPARDEDIYRGTFAAPRAASTPTVTELAIIDLERQRAAGHVSPPAPRAVSSQGATEF